MLKITVDDKSWDKALSLLFYIYRRLLHFMQSLFLLVDGEFY